MRRVRGESAFSLIEIMIAVTIFAIALSGLMALLFTNVRANASATEASNAMAIAESYLEELRLRSVTWKGVLPITTEMPALVPGDVIPPESLPGGILSSPTGAEIKVPDKNR